VRIEHRERFIMTIKRIENLVLRNGMTYKVPAITDGDYIKVADLFFYIGGDPKELAAFAKRRLGGSCRVSLKSLQKLSWSIDTSRCEIAEVALLQNCQNLSEAINYFERNSIWYVFEDDFKTILNKNNLYVNEEGYIVQIPEFSQEYLEEIFLDFWEEKKRYFLWM